MKVTFELKVYEDEIKTKVVSTISEVKDFPGIEVWPRENIENYLDEEHEIWFCKRTDSGWKA